MAGLVGADLAGDRKAGLRRRERKVGDRELEADDAHARDGPGAFGRAQHDDVERGGARCCMSGRQLEPTVGMDEERSDVRVQLPGAVAEVLGDCGGGVGVAGREHRRVVEQPVEEQRGSGHPCTVLQPYYCAPVAHYRSVGSVPPKRHTQHRPDGTNLAYEELMGEEGFSSDSSLLYHRNLPSRIVGSEEWTLPDLTTRPNHPLKPLHLKLHDLFDVDQIADVDVVRGRRLVLGNGDVRISYVVAGATVAALPQRDR